MKEIFLSQKEYYKLGYTQSVTYRETMLRRLKKALKEQEESLMEGLRLDLGKRYTESYITEFFMVYKSIDFAIKNLHKWTRDKKVRTPLLFQFGTSRIRHVPYGTSLILNAYNYPLLLSVDPLIGAIAGGNTVMLGLSKKSGNTNKALIELINNTFDSNYIFAFETDREINTTLLNLEFDKIFFTGSETVGKTILEKASQNLTSVTLELGGKSPAVVLRDANVKDAAENIVYSKVVNAGQTCIASDYVVVDEMIKDEFITELKKAFDKFYPTLTDYPKMVDKQSYDRITHLIKEDSKYCIVEGMRNDKTLQIPLTVLLSDIDSVDEFESMKDEIFGPLLPVFTYKDLDMALRVIARKNAPLALYVFGKRMKKINYVLDNLEFGGASVNATLLHMVNHNLPFSGFKHAGLGSYHGHYSFEAFTYKQSVYVKKGIQFHKVIFPPYKSYFKKTKK